MSSPTGAQSVEAWCWRCTRREERSAKRFSAGNVARFIRPSPPSHVLRIRKGMAHRSGDRLAVLMAPITLPLKMRSIGTSSAAHGSTSIPLAVSPVGYRGAFGSGCAGEHEFYEVQIQNTGEGIYVCKR